MQTAPEKPPMGAPCNGCGFCCAAEPCGVAVEMIGADPDEGPCPAMEFVSGRFRCGLILHPSHYVADVPAFADEVIGRMIADALGSGRGCDSDAPPTAAHAA